MMTLATMADRTLPLKARVRGLATVADSDAMGKPFEDALDALLADVAAADRLARTTDREVAARDALNAALERMYADPDKGRGMDTEEEDATYEAACNEHDAALAAWRALGEVDG